MLVDNAPENFRLQQENGLEIISWYNDPYDTELLDMMPFLKGNNFLFSIKLMFPKKILF
mgnify:CR=1 FL=1